VNKQAWLDVAEIMDAHRIIPKIIILTVFIGYGMLTYDTYFWIKEIYIKTGEIPATVSAYAGGTISALGMVLTLMVNKYFEGGRKWK
jgi:hypothetical protein